jgi:hypothetical protein
MNIKILNEVLKESLEKDRERRFAQNYFSDRIATKLLFLFVFFAIEFDLQINF